MNAVVSSSQGRHAIAHWLARISAIGVFGFFMMFAIGEGVPPLAEQPLRVQLFFALWAAIFAGYAVGWRWPLVGGVIALAGYAMLNVVEFSTNQRLLGGAFLLFAIPGVLYLIAAWQASRS